MRARLLPLLVLLLLVPPGFAQLEPPTLPPAPPPVPSVSTTSLPTVPTAPVPGPTPTTTTATTTPLPSPSPSTTPTNTDDGDAAPAAPAPEGEAPDRDASDADVAEAGASVLDPWVEAPAARSHAPGPLAPGAGDGEDQDAGTVALASPLPAGKRSWAAWTLVPLALAALAGGGVLLWRKRG